jgi:hypothetical protein
VDGRPQLGRDVGADLVGADPQLAGLAVSGATGRRAAHRGELMQTLQDGATALTPLTPLLT